MSVRSPCAQRYLPVIGILFCAGCFASPASRPLTTADLNRIATGKVVNASIERVNPHRFVSIQNDPAGSPVKLLNSMTPVIQSRRRDAGRLAEAEYVFIFQSGRDPIVFSIRVCGDVLCYSAGEFEYEGGNSGAFLKVVTPLVE